MTRARAKAIQDKVNSFLSTCDYNFPLNGLLPHADVLSVLRYNPQEATPKDQDNELEQKTQEEEEEDTPSPVLPARTTVVPARRPQRPETLHADAPTPPPHGRYYPLGVAGTTAQHTAPPVLPPAVLG